MQVASRVAERLKTIQDFKILRNYKISGKFQTFTKLLPSA